MNTQDFSSLFLFTRMSNHENAYTLDKATKNKLNSMYEKRINEFLNTWFIFSCNNGSCCHNKHDRTKLKNTLNVIENMFYIIFGDDYVKSTMKYILSKLIRFRHIIKKESEKTFEASYEDYVENGVVFKKVLSKKDPQYIIKTYREMFNYYMNILTLSNDELMLIFDNISSEIAYGYIGDIDSIENRVLPVIKNNVFYNNTQYNNIRSKLLPIFFELMCRFYESYNIDIYSKDLITSDNIVNFFEIKKCVISNDILYIFLKSSKDVLIYDFEDKLANDKNSLIGIQKLSVINTYHKIYLLSFNDEIVNMVYDDNNIILTFNDGTVLMNGKNNNHKLTSDSKKEYVYFINFYPFSLTSLASIKIFDKHIYITSTEGIIYICGDLNKNNPFFETSSNYKSNICIDEKHKEYETFTLSENEERIKFMKKNEIGYNYLFNAFSIKVKDNNKSLIVNSYEKEIKPIEFDFGKRGELITDIISLRDNGVIIETSKEINENVELSYYTLGMDPESTSRLGRKPLTNPSSSIYITEISSRIQKDKEGNLDKSISIKKALSTSNKTLILNSIGDIYGAGENDGYFMSINNMEGEGDEAVLQLETFKKINNNSTSEVFTDFVMTKNTKKTLVLEYNSSCAIGYGSYYFLGTNNSSFFRNNDDEVKLKLDSKKLNGTCGPTFYSYFCTPNFVSYTNPVYDLIYNFYRSNPEFDDRNMSHVRNSLMYLSSVSIDRREEAYKHMANNLTELSTNEDMLDINTQLVLFSNLQNYTMHDSMLLQYCDDKEKYSAVSKFINLIGLMSENYSSMKTDMCSLGLMSYDDFVKYIKDINIPSICDIEEKLDGTRNNRRAK